MSPPTADRLAALAAHLGETPAQVARTLHDELTRAVAEIDAGLSSGDVDRTARATHAARNSVLMLDDRSMLDVLRALQDASTRGDGDAVEVARRQLDELWTALAAQLQAA